MSNTLDQQVFTEKPNTVIHRCSYSTASYSVDAILVVSLTDRRMPIQSCPRAASFAPILTAPQKTKWNPEEPDSFFVLIR